MSGFVYVEVVYRPFKKGIVKNALVEPFKIALELRAANLTTWQVCPRWKGKNPAALSLSRLVWRQERLFEIFTVSLLSFWAIVFLLHGYRTST